MWSMEKQIVTAPSHSQPGGRVQKPSLGKVWMGSTRSTDASSSDGPHRREYISITVRWLWSNRKKELEDLATKKSYLKPACR